MKSLFFTVVVIFGLTACGNYTAIQQEKSINKPMDKTELVNQDSTEYELLILDTGFESWFVTKNMPATAHSNSYYKNWNLRYVSEWNRLFTEGYPYFENYIDYSPFENYGFDINYKLYNYFQFVEEQTGIKLVNR